MLIGEMLQKQAVEHPHRPFIKIGEATYTFRDFNRLVNQTAAWLLRDYDIKKGAHISIILPNQIDFLLLFFAIARAGGVVVPMNPHFKADLLSYMVGQSESSLVIFHRDVEMFETSESVKKIVIDNGEIVDLVRHIQDADLLPTDVNQDDLFSIIYTSGTTSRPKGVMNTQSAYLAAGRDISSALNISKDDVTYLFLPLFHANPQFYGIMSALIAGNTLLIDERFSASEFWKKAQQQEFTTFTYVGTVLSILLKTMPFQAPLQHQIKGVGGGAPKETWEQLTAKCGLKIHELYGMSETGGFVTINSVSKYKMGSVGITRDCVQVAILNEQDEVCGANVKGEIAIRPNQPNVIFNGYYNEPGKTVEVFSNLWFHTGDIGWFDQEGFFYFEGRKKDIIRKKGENISPTYIEEVFQKLDVVKEAAAVGISDEIAGEEIKLCLVMEEKEFSIEKLVQWGKEHLPEIMMPRYFERMDAFPKTATEKIEKHKLKVLEDQVIDIKQSN